MIWGKLSPLLIALVLHNNKNDLMSRVITFSRVFPVKHSRAGQNTYFMENMQGSLFNTGVDLSKYINNPVTHFSNNWWHKTPKSHTIRKGHRWKVGDKFSPRVWTGKPYVSKQYQFSDDVEIKKIWEFQIIDTVFYVNGRKLTLTELAVVAINDGLSLFEFIEWFEHPTPFDGQIICWDENINY